MNLRFPWTVKKYLVFWINSIILEKLSKYDLSKYAMLFAVSYFKSNPGIVW